MNSFKVEVVPVTLEKHPNADLLSIAKVRGWQCIVKTADFEGVALGAYIPLDALVPDTPEFEFLGKHKRIKTVRLRGVISQGLLLPAKSGWEDGQDVTEEMGIKKWEPPFKAQTAGDCCQAPGAFHIYTDIENWKNYTWMFQREDAVVITEKIHGTNFRAGVVDGKFYVGSHRTAKAFNPENLYWKAALRYDLENRMRETEVALNEGQNVILFGEIYGRIQDLHYGLENDFQARFFDISVNGQYESYEAFRLKCETMGLDTVPVLKRGMFEPSDIYLADGTAFQGGHAREGCVIKPEKEDTTLELGRKILKCVSEKYLLRKKGTEYH